MTQAAIDDPAGALQTLKLIKETRNRDWVLSRAVRPFVTRRDYDTAIKVAQAIQDDRNRQSCLVIIADAFDANGDSAAAMKIIRGMTDRELWFDAMNGLARRSLAAGNDRPMRHLISLMDAPVAQIHGFLAIVEEQLRRKDAKTAQATFAEAAKIANRAVPPLTWRLIVVQAQLGDVAKALVYLEDLDSRPNLDLNTFEVRAILIRDTVLCLCEQGTRLLCL